MFYLSIMSVRSSDNKGRALTFNQKESGNVTVVGRLYHATADTEPGQLAAKGFLTKNGGGQVTIIMAPGLAQIVKEAAESLYEVEQSPFYMLTFGVNMLQSSNYVEGIGHNMTMTAASFEQVRVSEVEPDILNLMYDNAPSDDAAYKTAVAYQNNMERRSAVQNQVVADANQTKAELNKNKKGNSRKPKAAATVKE